MFERFTEQARRALVVAQEEARARNHEFLGTEHVLLAVLREPEGGATKALEALGISAEQVRGKLEAEMTGAGDTAAAAPPFTPQAKKVLEGALREALDLGDETIGTEHLLLGLLREGEGTAAQVLVGLGADLEHTRREVARRGNPSS
jgi:ATP-dependent Clp protease ATP-binding subunit ClpC